MNTNTEDSIKKDDLAETEVQKESEDGVNDTLLAELDAIMTLTAAGAMPSPKQEEDFMAALDELKAEYPDEDIYYSFIPHNGFYAYRRQYMADTAMIEEKVADLSRELTSQFRKKNEKLITELRIAIQNEYVAANSASGKEKIQASSVHVPEELIIQRLPADVAKEFEKIDGQIEDMVILLTLDACVIYPRDIKEKIATRRIATGVPGIISRYIAQISGFVKDVRIRKG